ncbi:MAG: M23 family metallopeptidase [Candidatus Methanoperedens sp.]|nr:M23 family metallopeptidase [Candidatus Methanoperedens sp.]
MKYWPVPDSYSRIIEAFGSQGAFWEDRGDRYHCGVDIYAREGSDVSSIEGGKVVDIGIFTSKDKVSYWNTTSYILIKNGNGLSSKYAELGDVVVNVGESVKPGQLIGNVGLVLNSDEITQNSPFYIQKLKKKGNQSMLHFELYRGIPAETANYLAGNWFGKTKPENLLDPTDYLRSLLDEGML